MADTEKQKIVIVVGPTASGKTGLAVEVAKRFDGEVVSADSRQVYRGLDIGTAKVTEEETQGVPHHLIDIADIETLYTTADFKRDASATIEGIRARGKLPVIAGGTFFYIDVLLGRINMPDVPPNPELRDYLEELPADVLHHRLEELDPKRALTIDRNNKRRLIRALEIIEMLGEVPEPSGSGESPYESLTVGIDMPREELRARFRARGAEWLQQGFRAEVEGLLARGIPRERLYEIGFEYRLMLDLIDGKLDEDAFLERFVEKNWQYAKRQITWLQRDKTIRWFSYKEQEAIMQTVEQFLAK